MILNPKPKTLNPNTTGGTTLFKPTNFKDIVSYESDTANISNSSGLKPYALNPKP